MSHAATLSLPWLAIDARLREPAWLPHVRTATAKYGTDDGARTLSLRCDVHAATPASAAEAATTFETATVAYQFVRGHASASVSAFATADGSLARVAHATGHLDLLLRPDVFSAPYSTWADLVAAPLAEHWRAGGCHPLHAAAVSHGAQTVLIVGPSGSGKTTTALALLQAGGVWRADDKVLLTTDGDGIRSISLYRNTNVAPLTIGAFPALHFARRRPPLDATNNKRACDLEEITTAVNLASFAPTAVIFPVRGGGRDTILRRLTPTDTLLRLAAQSPASPVRSRARAQHDLLCRLAVSAPSFELLAAGDVLTAPETVARRVIDHIASSSGSAS